MTKDSFLNHIAKIRKWITADFIAKETGINSGSISRYLQGRGNNPTTFKKIVNAANKQYYSVKREVNAVQI